MADLNVGKLTFDLDVDASDFNRGLGVARRDLDNTFKGGAAGADTFAKGVGGANTQVVGLSNSLKGMALAAGAAFSAGALLRGIQSTVSAASDLEESQSKVTQVFTEQAGVVTEWSRTSANAFGISQQAALEAAGTYGNLFQAFGLGVGEAQEMSTTLVELAADLASFNNTSMDDAILALRSGLSGETEPLKRYGVALTDARMRAEAMALGIYNGVGALDAAQKAQAAYGLILKDTVLAQGDFERTSDGLANQQRILAAEVQNLQANLGQALLPAMKELVSTGASLAKWANDNRELITSLLKVAAVLGTVTLAAKGYRAVVASLPATHAAAGASAGIMATRVGASMAAIGNAAKGAMVSLGPLLIALGFLEGLPDTDRANDWARFNPQAPSWVGRLATSVDSIPLVSDLYSALGINPMDAVDRAVAAEARGAEIDRLLAAAGMPTQLGIDSNAWRENQSEMERGETAFEEYVRMMEEANASFMSDHPLFGEVSGREARRAASERVRLAEETVRKEKEAMNEIARYHPIGSDKYRDAQQRLSDAQQALNDTRREADKARGISGDTLLNRARRQANDAERDAGDLVALRNSNLSQDAIKGLLDIEGTNPGTIRRLVKDGLTEPWVNEVNAQFTRITESADLFSDVFGQTFIDDLYDKGFRAGNGFGRGFNDGWSAANPHPAADFLAPGDEMYFGRNAMDLVPGARSGITINGGVTVQANDPKQFSDAMLYEERKLSLQGRG